MQIDYNVSGDGLRIDTFPKGVLDIKGTIDYFYRIKNDERIKRGAVEIVNFKYVYNFKISRTESKQITESYQEAKSQQKIKATIFVCENVMAYAIGMMLQTFHQITNPEHNVLVLRSEDELEDTMNQISPNTGYKMVGTLNAYYLQMKHE